VNTDSVNTAAGPAFTAWVPVVGTLTELTPWLSVLHGLSGEFATNGSTVIAFNSVTRAELARQLNGVVDGTELVVAAAAGLAAANKPASPTTIKAAFLRALQIMNLLLDLDSHDASPGRDIR
jgi:hypothetical protein